MKIILTLHAITIFVSLLLSQFCLRLSAFNFDSEEDVVIDGDYNIHNSVFPQQLSLSDWDSSFYGKPICTNIPKNMSLCSNINYNQMKVPNMIGHESVEEVCIYELSINSVKFFYFYIKIVYQSSIWIPLVTIKCHKDTQLFLCSLFAPICLDQPIYPCRSLCESVKRGCEVKMNQYSYQWPAMFNCSKFPDDNGLCIQPDSSSSQIGSTEKSSSTSTRSKPSATTNNAIISSYETKKVTKPEFTTIFTTKSSSKNGQLNKKKEQSTPTIMINKSIEECTGCNGFNTEDNIIEMFCTSDIGRRLVLFDFQFEHETLRYLFF